MDVRQEIIAALTKASHELFPNEDVPVVVGPPKDESHGDYSSNIAMAIFAKLKSQNSNLKTTAQSAKFRNPLELAQEIVNKWKMENGKWKMIDHVDVAPPGFINFYISKDYLVDQLRLVLDSLRSLEQYGRGGSLKDRKIMVEFTDPNPFKEFHIGHLYSNAIGESLCRLLESQGANVRRVCYQGDIGLHVAKALYGLSVVIPNLFRDPQEILKRVQDDTLQEKVKFMGQAYADGARAYEEDPKAKEEINQLNKKIYEIDSSVTPQNDISNLYQKGRAWSLEYFETIYKRLGTTFVTNYFESVAGPIGLSLVKDHIKDGVFKESEGAVIFEGEKYGLHNRVFINSLGLPTYEAKDMGLPQTKYKDFPYDTSIIITANEQNAYFQVVLQALSLINPDLAAKTQHIGHGMVRLPTGKMSSRTGDVITGEWLLDEAKKKIQEQYTSMDEEAAEKVAVGAVKYALLKSGIGRDIAFNFDESISLEGNSGPYLQYTYTRTRSVLRKATDVIPNLFRDLARHASLEMLKLVQHDKINAEELSLLRSLHRFPEIVGEAAEKFSPNVLCTYLFDLAQKFNLFYQKHQILSPHVIPSEVEGSHSSKADVKDSSTPQSSAQNDISNFRVALTAGVGQVLKNGLDLLGIKAPEKM